MLPLDCSDHWNSRSMSGSLISGASVGGVSAGSVNAIHESLVKVLLRVDCIQPEVMISQVVGLISGRFVFSVLRSDPPDSDRPLLGCLTSYSNNCLLEQGIQLLDGEGTVKVPR